MKQRYTILLGMLLVLPLQAQNESFHMFPDSPSFIARISLVTPSFVFEFAPSDHFTFTTGSWIRPSFWSPDDEGNNEFHPRPSLNPRITLEPRYYFNLEHRNAKGKRTDFYSGWYIGMPFALGFPDLKFSMGTAMGFQCTFGRRWYWNIGLGPGFTYEESQFSMYGVSDVGFGIILN